MGLFSFLTRGHPMTGVSWRLGVATGENTSRLTDDTTSTVYACCKILSDNLSRMPVSIKKDDDSGSIGYKTHELWNLLHNAPNAYQSPQVFMSTLEYHRNYYGNAFARIYRRNGKAIRFEIVHPDHVVDSYKVNGKLYYSIQIDDNKVEKHISSDDILHFRAISENGIFGLSPIYALRKEISIVQNVEDTLDNFYQKRATPSLVLSSTLGDVKSYQVLRVAQEDFLEKYGGPTKAGEVITLPPNTKLESMAANYASAELIETMKLNKVDIASVYSIPLYLLGNSSGDDAENSSLTFRNYTVAPIAAMYRSEFEFKLLSNEERNNGVTIEFDLDALIEADLVAKTKSVAEQVKSGVSTPNEAAVKLGNSKIQGEYGDKHFMQAQYIPLEDYGNYDVFGEKQPTSEDSKTPNKIKNTTKQTKQKE